MLQLFETLIEVYALPWICRDSRVYVRSRKAGVSLLEITERMRRNNCDGSSVCIYVQEVLNGVNYQCPDKFLCYVATLLAKILTVTL